MEFKKPQIIIVALLILWILFIGWGVVKTTLQLSKQKTISEEVALQEPEVSKLLIEEIPEEAVSEIAPTLVRALKIKRADFFDTLPVMGTVKGKTEIELRFEINGVINSIYFDEGDKVKKGDLIASLNAKDAQLKLEYASNKLASAQATYQSSLKKLEVHQKLYEAGAIIKSKFEEIELECESAKYQFETTKSEVGLAKSELEKTNLYAYVDGVMGPREAEEGEFVTPQDKVGLLLEVDSIFVEVGIVERDIDKINLGQKAKVFVDAYPNVAFEGIVDKIFPMVEGKSRTLTVKIKVPNREGLLLPGMFCRAEISIIDLPGAILVPSTTLIYAGVEQTLIAVIPEETQEVEEGEIKKGNVILSQVTVGYLTSDYAQITEGLDEGDLVVIEARGELKDNMQVRIGAIEELNI